MGANWIFQLHSDLENMVKYTPKYLIKYRGKAILFV